jgi:hypothetical protein
MSEIHREGLIFEWTSSNHKIVFGLKRVGHGKCNICGKRIPKGNNICNECFEKEKKISKK